MSETRLEIGSIGTRIDLLIKQGGTFGPHEVTLKNPDGSPVNLTGCTFAGSVKRKPKDTAGVPFAFGVLDAAGGKFTFGMADEATATIQAGDLITDLASKYVHDINMTDALGQVQPLFYGDVKVFRRVT